MKKTKVFTVTNLDILVNGNTIQAIANVTPENRVWVSYIYPFSNEEVIFRKSGSDSGDTPYYLRNLIKKISEWADQNNYIMWSY